MNKNKLYTNNYFDKEHDACAIIALVRKDGIATHGNLQRVINALDNMGHRTGEIDQEGDGTGIQTDIPKVIWCKKLAQKEKDSRWVYNPQFTVLHLMITKGATEKTEAIIHSIENLLSSAGYDVIYSNEMTVSHDALGIRATTLEPLCWNMAMIPQGRKTIAEAKSYELHLKIEKLFPEVHVVSFSQNSAIYKIRGDVRTLQNYYPELKHPDFKSAITLGHGRYSTNTESIHERAQMFSTLGHNGEINTIMRLRHEAKRLGIQLVHNGSDSQDLDRMIENLMFTEDFTLMEAMEIIFPPIWSDIQKMDDEAKKIYTHFRQYIGMIAQGPAAIIARQGDEIVFSVDALGLRPLWFGETDKEYFASSEKGVIPIENMEIDPIPIAPGEKKGLWLKRPIVIPDVLQHMTVTGNVEIFDHAKLREFVIHRLGNSLSNKTTFVKPNKPKTDSRTSAYKHVPISFYQAMGWKQDEWEDITSFMQSGKEPISGMGYDGPLAFLSQDITNIPEFIKERVAVVTNPSIDREREGDHFNLTTFLGARPMWRMPQSEQILLDSPLVLSGIYNHDLLQQAATLTSLHDIIEVAKYRHQIITTSLNSKYEFPTEKEYKETISTLIQSVQKENSSILILDDREFFEKPNHHFDPFVFLSMLNQALDQHLSRKGRTLRLETSIILVSGQLRNTHDCVVALGLGADAISPYLTFERAVNDSGENLTTQLNLVVSALTSGIEKVMSTLGIHDISGYSSLFASIGLKKELADALHITNALGDSTVGFSFENLTTQQNIRINCLKNDLIRLKPDTHLYPKVWKKIADVAQGQLSYSEFLDKLREVTKKTPVSIRHLLDIQTSLPPITEPDISIDGYDAPFYISAMSFGSQGEIAYRTYFEGAVKENIFCMNGEGGELPDLLGKHYRHRGQQVASGRFGVNAALLNSARFIEIKVGQGAKPGEGGHLPGFKVTAKIAEARHTSLGVDLISPSNNHDIYSIEDLAQLIEELKTVNPNAKVSVKIPAIPNIGPIATGIAKANADIITISGFDGGTGAARRHSLKYVGFPTEIALLESHQALVQSQLRDKVEIWADGGIKSTDDILKFMLLGANRVGMGTMAMVAIGCTLCRDCHTGTCHVGITAHFPDKESAFNAGVQHYEPRNFEQAVKQLTHLIHVMKDDLKQQAALLGFERLQDCVGKNHLLEQTRETEKINLQPLLTPTEKIIPTLSTSNEKWFVVQKPKTGLSKMIAENLVRHISQGHEHILYRDDRIGNTDRAVGAASSGELARLNLSNKSFNGKIFMDLTGGTIPGNGLGSFLSNNITIRIQGGVQDGSAKSASGGKMVILKGMNHNGKLVDGSVGKCFAYGAQNGTFFVQGTADSRSCIRLSGASIVFGKRLEGQRFDENIIDLSQSDLKGFAFEYMTSGHIVVLGDPGPWMCSGMTGGTIYFRLYPEVGFTVESLQRRLASNAKIVFQKPNEEDESVISRLLNEYYLELIHTGLESQIVEAEFIKNDLHHISSLFVVGKPTTQAAIKKETLRAVQEN